MVMGSVRTASWLLVLGVLLGGCDEGSGDGSELALEVESLDGEVTQVTWDQLRGMETIEGYGGILNTVGRITPPSRYKGVPLAELTDLAGGLDETTGLQVVASDEYAVTFSRAQVESGSVVTFDPETGEPTTIEAPPAAVVAYERESERLSDDDGPLRVAYVTEEPVQVTDGHLWVKMVALLRLVPQQLEWTLRLEGARAEEIDRTLFESGSAPGCHQARWTDGDGRVWRGVPLWLLVGWVDDENVHRPGAFNRMLAAQGYPIELISGSGDSVTLLSDRIADDDEVFLAYEVDGERLEGADAPLRLVGPSLDPAEMLGGIVEIRLDLP